MDSVKRQPLRIGHAIGDTFSSKRSHTCGISAGLFKKPKCSHLSSRHVERTRCTYPALRMMPLPETALQRDRGQKPDPGVSIIQALGVSNRDASINRAIRASATDTAPPASSFSLYFLVRTRLCLCLSKSCFMADAAVELLAGTAAASDQATQIDHCDWRHLGCLVPQNAPVAHSGPCT
jgi:hypothetical protein